MNRKEKANYKKLVKDIAIENLSDQEIVEMWRAPAAQKLEEGLSSFKLEQFLISKGVSKDYASKGVKWIRSETGIKDNRSVNKVTFGSVLKDLFRSLTSKFQ